MLAIHASSGGFHPHWVRYCEQQQIPFKLVDCYATDVIQQLKGCTGLFWHHSQNNPKDLLVAKQILFALEHSGFKVFPDFRTGWHFDDKLAQKYLFEKLGILTPPAHVFFDRGSALEWATRTAYPKVFKLRHGAGSAGVRLVRTELHARRLIGRAFGRGFPVYDPWDNLKERIYRWRTGAFGLYEIVKALVRFAYPPRFSRLLGRQWGYVYFQDYVPGNEWDTRIIVIGSRAFGMRRFVRPGDFRASGSGRFSYDPTGIELDFVRAAFDAAGKLASDCAAFDFVEASDGTKLVLEVSFGFSKEGYEPCPGYWDAGLNWHECIIDPQGWMVEQVIRGIS